MPTELPLRIVDQPGGATVRCLCGIEAATLRRGLAFDRAMTRTGSGVNPYQGQLAPDVTTPGLMMMVAHAIGCKRGQAILAVQQRAWAGLG